VSVKEETKEQVKTRHTKLRDYNSSMAFIVRPKKASFIKVRFLIAIMATLCPIVCYISRQNLSLAMVAMIEDSSSIQPKNNSISNSSTLDQEDFNTCPAPTIMGLDGKEELAPKAESYGPKYGWDSSERSFIFESFFWTYVVFQIPGARVAEIVGAKWILAIAGVGSSILSLIAPSVASLGPYAFALTRALMGICQTALYPACYVLYSHWFPPTERSQLLPALGAGAYIGSIITSTATGYFSEQESLGWEYAFYMPSVICAIWSIIWILIGASKPREHAFISLEEISSIEFRMELSQTCTGLKKSPSWRKIATSQHIWTFATAFLASSWSFSIVLLLLPSYLNYVLHISPLKNGLINSVIYILFCISSPIVGAVSTLMIETRPFGLTRLQTRKLFECTALFSQAVGFVLLPLIGCDQILVLGVLYTMIVLYSGINGGEVQLPSELSLDFTGTIYAIGNCVGSSTGFIVPRVHSLIVSNLSDIDQWNIYFYFAAAVTFIGGAIFLIFGKNDLQDFSKDSGESQLDAYQMSTDRGYDSGSMEKPKEKQIVI